MPDPTPEEQANPWGYWCRECGVFVSLSCGHLGKGWDDVWDGA